MRKAAFCIFLVLVFIMACTDIGALELMENDATQETASTPTSTPDWPPVSGPDEGKKGLFFVWNTTQPEDGKPPIPFDYWREALDTLHGEETGAINCTY